MDNFTAILEGLWNLFWTPYSADTGNCYRATPKDVSSCCLQGQPRLDSRTVCNVLPIAIMTPPSKQDEDCCTTSIHKASHALLLCRIHLLSSLLSAHLSLAFSASHQLQQAFSLLSKPHPSPPPTVSSKT